MTAAVNFMYPQAGRAESAEDKHALAQWQQQACSTQTVLSFFLIKQDSVLGVVGCACMKCDVMKCNVKMCKGGDYWSHPLLCPFRGRSGVMVSQWDVYPQAGLTLGFGVELLSPYLKLQGTQCPYYSFTSTAPRSFRILFFLSLWLDTSHPLQRLFRKWGQWYAVCFFGVMVRCHAFLPSGIRDNAVIQSTSHLLPFTLLEETITGCDGPLSIDEAHSHFLDGCVHVCVLYQQRGLFQNTRATPLWQSHSGDGLFQYCVCVCLSVPHAHTLSVLMSFI